MTWVGMRVEQARREVEALFSLDAGFQLFRPSDDAGRRRYHDDDPFSPIPVSRCPAVMSAPQVGLLGLKRYRVKNENVRIR